MNSLINTVIRAILGKRASYSNQPVHLSVNSSRSPLKGSVSGSEQSRSTVSTSTPLVVTMLCVASVPPRSRSQELLKGLE